MEEDEEYRHRRGVEEDFTDDSDNVGEEEEGNTVVHGNTALLRQPTAFDPNKHTRGKILRIELTDFMCHKRLDVKFFSGINFITGPNGSGKSAIVAALQVALGLTASETGRASKLSELIRNGSSGPAIVRIFLQNDRDTGFMYSELGEEICVEKVLNRPPLASTSKILNGKTLRAVCTKKADIDRLCEEFCLYVDNPCCVMDQDEVKVFLRGTAQQKYNFFLKATDLNTISVQFAREKEEREQIKAQYAEKEKSLVQVKRRRDQARNEYDAMMAVRNISDELEQTRLQLIWAQVKELGDMAQNEQQGVQSAEQRYLQCKHDLDEIDAASLSATQRLDELKTQHEHLKIAHVEKMEHVTRAKKDLARAMRPLQDIKSQCDAKKVDIDRYRQRLESRQQELNQLLRSQQDNRVLDLTERLQVQQDKLRSVELKLERANEMSSESNMDHLMDKKEELEREIAKAQQHSAESTSRCRDIEGDLQRAEQQLRNIRNIRVTSPLSKFAHWVPLLMELVHQNRDKFRQLPLFVGEHVRLIDPKYIRPVEQAIYSTLLNFVCDSIEDERLLRKLAVEQLKVQSNELVVNVRRFQPERYQIQPLQYTTMASVLDISNANVYNTLVDINRVEKMVLVDTKEQGDAMFLGTASKAYLPQGVIAVMDLEGNSFNVRGGSRVFDSNSNTKPPRFLTGESVEQNRARQLESVQSSIEMLKSRLQQTRAEGESHRQAVQRLQREYADTKRSVDTFQDEIESTNRQRTDLLRDCDRLQSEIDRLTASTSNSKLEKIKAHIDVDNETIASLKQEWQDMQNEIAQMERDTISPLQQAQQEAEQELNESKREIQRLANEQNAFAEEYQPQSYSKAQAQNKLADAMAKREKHAAALAMAQQKYEDQRNKALELTGEEIHPTATRDKLTKQYRVLNKAMEEEKCRSEGGESIEVRLVRVEKEKVRAETNYEVLQRDLLVVEKRMQRLKKGMKMRKQRFEQFRQWAEKSTKETFSELLKQKGHDGDVLFNHDTKALDIKWHRKALAAGSSTQANDEDSDEEEEETGAGGGVSDAKSLSGGERSITTLALLIAMGRNVASPFRVMDEFDVFMDATARSIAIDQLVTDARQSVHGLRKQCIFLTPLDITEIKDAPDLIKQVIKPSEDNYGGQAAKRTKV